VVATHYQKRSNNRGVPVLAAPKVPQSFDTDAALIERIASVPGAIGYVGKLTSHEKVKELTVK